FSGLRTPQQALAWDAEITHTQLSNAAFDTSILGSAFDRGILHDLGCADDAAAKFEVFQGAINEDLDPGLRYLNHFHNPLCSSPWNNPQSCPSPWPTPGLNDFFQGESSLLWAQDDENDWSWQAVRQLYLHALTTSTPVTCQDKIRPVMRGL